MTSFPQVIGAYDAQLPSGFIPATGGSYTFTSSGAQIGEFNVSVSYTNPLSWTNSSAIAAVTRANGQNVTWSGGAPGSWVVISGSTSNATVNASFTCYAQASAGNFMIPSYVLLGLPSGSGSMALENVSTPVSFTASGLDFGTVLAGISFSISPSYQ